MLWLDSTYPPEKEGQPGAARGDCGQDTGVPADVESQYPDSYVPYPYGGRYFGCLLFPVRLSGPTSDSDLSAPPSPSKRASRYSSGVFHGVSRSYNPRLSTQCSTYREAILLFEKHVYIKTPYIQPFNSTYLCSSTSLELNPPCFY